MTTQVSNLCGINSTGRSVAIENAKYLGILLGLLAFGLTGHRTHWSFGYANHSEMEATENNSQNSEAVTRSRQPAWSVTFPSNESLQKSGVETQRLEQRPMSEIVKSTGVIAYDDRLTARLSSRVSGTVWRVIKQVGDPVQRGDVLFIVEATEVGRAKAEFLQELVAVEAKQEYLKALELAANAIPGQRIREANVTLRESRIRLQNSEQTLVNLGLHVRKEDYETLTDAERTSRLHFLGFPDSMLGELDHSTTTSNLLAVRAPFDGVVIRHDATLGEMTAAGTPILEIADLRKMWLKLDISKENSPRLSLGQRVKFRPDGVDHELEGQVTWINTEMNLQTRTLQIRAEVDNPVVSSNVKNGHEVRLLRANTFGTGTIVLRESELVFAVPGAAVLHTDDQPIVFVRTGELSFSRLNVKLGLRESTKIQIESDELRPGMEVVTRGGHMLKSEWLLNGSTASRL